MPKKLNTEDFIKKAKEIHGNRYDYSKVEYINSQTKVCIICKEHGEFWQRPALHLSQQQGCPKCGNNLVRNKLKIITEEFIKKAKQVHGDRYDYSKVNYINYNTKVCIICKEHGEFWQRPSSHLHGSGCPKCGGTKKLNTEEFIEKSKEIHGDRYDYSKVEYINAHTKVCIICPEHGEFWMVPNAHLSQKQDCPKCMSNYKSRNPESKNNLTTEEFIEKAKKIHGDRYDYSKVEYVKSILPVKIICKKCGIEFLQTPHKHLSGHGCIFCNESKGERKIRVLLEKSGLKENEDYFLQYRDKWLCNQSLDFFFPKLNIGIEYDGIQHFKPIKRFGGEEEFKNIQNRDRTKNLLCEEHRIKLIRIPYVEINNIPNIMNEIIFI